MRVTVLVKATEHSEKGILPTAEMFEAMGRYNEELVNAGRDRVEARAQCRDALRSRARRGRGTPRPFAERPTNSVAPGTRFQLTRQRF